MKSILSDNKRIVLLIILLCIFIRLCAILAVHNFNNPESWEDGKIAKFLVKGEGFVIEGFDFGPRFERSYTAFAAPFYPFFLALIFKIFGITPFSYIFIQIIHLLISMCTVYTTHTVAEKLFNNKRVSIIAITIVAIFPTFIFSVTQIIRISFIIFFTSLIILQIWRLENDSSIFNSVLLGFLFALTALMEPIILSFLPFCIIWLIFIKLRSNTLNLIKIVSIIILTTFLFISPWTYRNYKIFNKFILIKSQFGLALYIGNNQHATGTARRSKSMDDLPVSIPSSIYNKMINLNDVERDEIFLREAIEFIKNNPTHTIKLMIQKIYYFWWRDPTHPLTNHFLYKIPWLILLSLFFLGLIISLNNWKRNLLIYFLFASFTFVYSITIVVPRYRIPLETFVIIFAAVGIEYLIRNAINIYHTFQNKLQRN